MTSLTRNEKRRIRYAEHPEYREKKRAGKLRDDYGLTQADYDFMVAAQGGLCAICERKPSQKLCVDHCHATRRLRFLLCPRCNTGLGYFDDDPRLLRRALAYAEFWQRLNAAGIASRLVPERANRKHRRRAPLPAPTPHPAPQATAGGDAPPHTSQSLLPRDSETPGRTIQPPAEADPSRNAETLNPDTVRQHNSLTNKDFRSLSRCPTPSAREARQPAVHPQPRLPKRCASAPGTAPAVSPSHSTAHDPEKACPGPEPGWIPVFGRRSCAANGVPRDSETPHLGAAADLDPDVDQLEQARL
jgi:hypothetical protein